MIDSGLMSPTEYEIEFGLRLPDGKQVWPPNNFHGGEFQTDVGRQKVCEAIGQAVRRMGLPVVETMDRYRWLTRRYEVVRSRRLVDEDVNIHDIDDPNMLESPSQAGTQDPE